MSAYVTLEDRRYLRAVHAGQATQSAGGIPTLRGRWAAGQRDGRHARPVEQGWVHELPDQHGTYRLTALGVRMLDELSARSAPVTVRQVAS